MKVDVESQSTLKGTQLAWARLGWVVVALTMFVAIIASWPPYLRLLNTVCETCPLTPAYVETLLADGISAEQWVVSIIIPSIMVYLGWMGMGVVIFLLKSNDRRALLFSALIIMIGASFGGTIGLLANHVPAWVWPSNIINTLSFPCLVGLIYLFPNNKFQPRSLGWLLLVQTVLFIPIPIENLNFPIAYNFVMTISMVIFCLLAPVYRYRRIMTLTERQQTKWVIFGIVLAMVGIATTITIVASNSAACENPNLFCDMVQNIGYSLSPLMIPIFIGIGILRSRLWDIDLLIRRTLVYTVLTATLALVYFGLVILLERTLSSLVGSSGQVATVISTLAIFILFTPLRRRVQEAIDRRFYRRKYNAEKALAEFAATARAETDLEALSAQVVSIVQHTMQPEQVSLWLKGSNR